VSNLIFDLVPVIAIALCVAGGGTAACFFMRRAKKDKKVAPSVTANEFINVKDIHGSILYTNDGLALCYLKLTPVSVDLYSKTEKENIVRTLTAEMSALQHPFKFIAVSRPIDVSPLLAELNALLMSSNARQRELLKSEMIEMSNYAMGGDIVERQFYIVIWDKATEGVERELTGRARVLADIFVGSRIPCEVLQQMDILLLCNLVHNPSYTHIEDSNFEAAIPLIEGTGIRL
jgi:hypothetical protein